MEDPIVLARAIQAETDALLQRQRHYTGAQLTMRATTSSPRCPPGAPLNGSETLTLLPLPLRLCPGLQRVAP